MKKNEFKSLLKTCIAEVIVEPSSNTISKKEFTTLIKECVIEVLKERLTETFDPQSQGPNPVQTNPYPQWNSKMAKMEEDDHNVPDRFWFIADDGSENFTIPSLSFEESMNMVDELFGEWSENQGNYDFMNYSITQKTPDIWTIYNSETQGTYYLIDLESNSPSVNKMKKKFLMEEIHSRYAQTAGAGQFDPRTFGPENSTKTFQEIKNEQDPNGTNHDLRLTCVKCGRSETCKCSKPKRKFNGICPCCSETK